MLVQPYSIQLALGLLQGREPGCLMWHKENPAPHRCGDRCLSHRVHLSPEPRKNEITVLWGKGRGSHRVHRWTWETQTGMCKRRRHPGGGGRGRNGNPWELECGWAGVLLCMHFSYITSCGFPWRFPKPLNGGPDHYCTSSVQGIT